MKKTYFYHSPVIPGEKRYTVAGIAEGSQMALGVAACSVQDTFVKKTGREIAIKRAEQAESGVVQIGKNPSLGNAFRRVAQGLVSSLLPPKVSL